MLIKIENKCIELSEWTIHHGIYLLRLDKSEITFNNAIGFLISTSSPRFFGSDFFSLIETWHDLKGLLFANNIEKNKKIIDDFITIIST